MCSSRQIAAIPGLALACLLGTHSAQVNAAPAEAASPAPAHLRIVAYVTNWSMPAVIHPEKLTHINLAFAHIDDHGRAVFDQPAVAADNLKTLRALKQKNPALKILVSVGGWMADGFSDAALTDASRRTFARSAVDLLHRYSLDGIDIDWEYPGQGVAGIKYRPEDKEHFTLLLKALREQLDAARDVQQRRPRDRYLLTIASADREYFDHTEMNVLHVYLDWINIMSYDFFNSLTATTGHHAGLYRAASAAETDRNVDASVRQHLAAGIPPGKLSVGVPFYGRGFAGVEPLQSGLHQRYERYEGDHSYAELAEKLIGKQDFVRYWDDRAQAPYLWSSTARIFVSYDDPRSIAVKARYVLEHRLGGVMIWELSQDRDDELLDVIASTLPH